MDARIEAVETLREALDRALVEHREWLRLQESRCIHGGACGDPFCMVDGSDEL